MAKQAQRNPVPQMKDVHDMTDEDWQSEDEWEDEAWICEPRSPENAFAVHAVTFAQDDLNAVREAADRVGLRTGEYIRLAAMEKVAREAKAKARKRAG